MSAQLSSTERLRRAVAYAQAAARAGLYGAVAAIGIAIGGTLALTVLSWGAITPSTLWPQGLFFQVTVGMAIFGALLAVGIWAMGARRDRWRE